MTRGLGRDVAYPMSQMARFGQKLSGYTAVLLSSHYVSILHRPTVWFRRIHPELMFITQLMCLATLDRQGPGSPSDPHQ